MRSASPTVVAASVWAAVASAVVTTAGSARSSNRCAMAAAHGKSDQLRIIVGVSPRPLPRPGHQGPHDEDDRDLG
jgi:hypothetical protein